MVEGGRRGNSTPSVSEGLAQNIFATSAKPSKENYCDAASPNPAYTRLISYSKLTPRHPADAMEAVAAAEDDSEPAKLGLGAEHQDSEATRGDLEDQRDLGAAFGELRVSERELVVEVGGGEVAEGGLKAAAGRTEPAQPHLRLQGRGFLCDF